MLESDIDTSLLLLLLLSSNDDTGEDSTVAAEEDDATASELGEYEADSWLYSSSLSSPLRSALRRDLANSKQSCTHGFRNMLAGLTRVRFV